MAAKTWKCLMPGCPSRINDPSEQFRDSAPNTCAGCGRWHFLPHSLAAGVVVTLIAVIGGVIWLAGMPKRNYEARYLAYLRNDGQIDEKEQQELTKLAERYHLNSETLAQIQDEVKQQLGLTVKPTQATKSSTTVVPTPTDQPRGTNRELVALLHNIYSDHLKTADEQQLLTEALKKQQLDVAQGEQLEQQVKARWGRAQPYFERALTAAKQSQHQRAIEEFQRALTEDADNAWIFANLSAAYLQAGRPEDALASCQRALDFDARNWLAHYNLASCHIRNGHKETAISELQQALECVAEDRTQHITKDEVIRQIRTDATFGSIRQDARFR